MTGVCDNTMLPFRFCIPNIFPTSKFVLMHQHVSILGKYQPEVLTVQTQFSEVRLQKTNNTNKGFITRLEIFPMITDCKVAVYLKRTILIESRLRKKKKQKRKEFSKKNFFFECLLGSSCREVSGKTTQKLWCIT